jgi:hypothetical protein
MDKNYFGSFSFSVLLDFVKVPDISFRDGDTGEYISLDDEQPGSDDVLQELTGGTALFSGSYEARFNVKNFSDKASLSINVPVLISFSGFNVNGKTGEFGCYLELPLMVGYNLGYHSTYNNIDMIGFSVAAGVKYIKLPLFIGNYGQRYFPEGRFKRSFIQPTASLSWKADKIKSIDGFLLNVGMFNGWSFRMSAIYIFNY